MCGIVGYIGRNQAVPVLLDGLRRLEYRGYDSAGVATISGGAIETRKRIGRIANLAALLQQSPLGGDAGISHTRWATHGGVTDENAHPHLDQSGRSRVCHNGVIENYADAARSARPARATPSPRRPTPRCSRISSANTTTR